MSINVCCFTGHRPYSFPFGSDESSVAFTEFKKTLDLTVERLVKEGCRCFLTGMAEGFDIWAAESVLRVCRRVPAALWAVVPFSGHRQRISPRFAERYDMILRCADSVKVLADGYSPSRYRERNKYMVDNSDAVIAAYDRRNPRSGTGQTVRYALSLGRHVIELPLKF